jgi:hypothetical protein
MAIRVEVIDSKAWCRGFNRVGSLTDRYEELQEQGRANADAHNAALDEIEYDDRYLSYLAQSEEAQAAMAELRDRLGRERPSS